VDLTRRDLGKLALAAIPASRLLAKPNSNFDGVQVGVITYSYRSMPGANDAEALLKYIVGFWHQLDRIDGPGSGDLCGLAGHGRAAAAVVAAADAEQAAPEDQADQVERPADPMAQSRAAGPGRGPGGGGGGGGLAAVAASR